MKVKCLIAVIAPTLLVADEVVSVLPPDSFVRVSNRSQTKTWGVLQNPKKDADHEYEARRVLARNPTFFLKPLLARVAKTEAQKVVLDLVRTQAEIDALAAWCLLHHVDFVSVIVGEPTSPEPLDTGHALRTFYLSNPTDAGKYAIVPFAGTTP